MTKRIALFFYQREESMLLLFILVLSGLIHGYNMFHYPYFENDEGTYFAQAWSFLSQGKLAPYTYWYDHAPLGWIFTSLWIFLTGGLFSFDFSLNSARILMLVIHLGSTFLLFKIAKKISNSTLTAVISSLFFSLSPLAVYFQRRLLLDNLMTFWLLLSLYFILFSKDKLWRYFASALSFGIAVLTKENAVFFAPVYLGLIIYKAHQHHRAFVLIKWLVIVGMVVSIYPLYALLKKELFPSGQFFSPNTEHVSLLGTLKLQASRGSGLPFWHPQSDFHFNFIYWLSRDAVFMILGFACFFIQGVAAIFSAKSRIIFFLSLAIVAFLVSGKLVINFYIIPLIPFLSLCIGFSLTQFLYPLRHYHRHISIFVAVFFSCLVLYHYSQDTHLKEALTSDETANQLAAISWVKKNISTDKFMAIDYYGNLDLSENKSPGQPQFKNADWYWKVDLDPDIKLKKIHGDFTKIDYIMLTAQMFKDMSTAPLDSALVKAALNNSSKIAVFSNDPTSEFTLPSYPRSHPNGDWVAIFKQDSPQDKLRSVWLSYKKNSINNQNWQQTSAPREKATALLSATFANDQESFDQLLNWLVNNLSLSDKNLFASSYGQLEDGSWGITNKGTTTDVDEDVALALIIGFKKWSNTKYQALAKQILTDLWQYETVQVKDQRYVVAGDWTGQPNRAIYTINPSYFAPYAYRLFAEVDPSHPWAALIDSSYQLLSDCSSAALATENSTFLPPNWCSLKADGKVTNAKDIDPTAANYSYDATKIPWKIALDYQWNKDPRALNFLQQMTTFNHDWLTKQKVAGEYAHDGLPLDDSESLTHYGSLLGYFSLIDKKVADEIYFKKIMLAGVNENDQSSYWGNNSSSYDQLRIWLGVSLYANNLAKPN